MSSTVITLEGHRFFRMRLILATISGRPIKIKNIRNKEENPGIQDFESDLLKLLEKLSNGATIVVNESGTTVFYQPGLLSGGAIAHSCSPSRSLGYYLELICCIAAFCKQPIVCTLHGVTNNKKDPSVDLLKLTTLPVLKRFLGTDEGLELKLNRRGAAPEGGGEVVFRSPCRQKLRPLQLITQGKVKRIRGVAWAARVAPTTCNRMIESARSLLCKFIPDVYIYSDHYKGPSSGKSPGYGLTLVAETIEGVFLGAEACANPKGSAAGPSVPEDIGLEASQLLMEEISRGGCVDSTNQSLACLMMALGDQDVSKVVFGQLSPYTIGFLRQMRDILQVVFKLDKFVNKLEDDGTDEVPLRLGEEKIMATCVGIGYRNFSKVIA